MRCNICDKNTLEHGKMKFWPDPDSKIGVICTECKEDIAEIRGEWNAIDAADDVDKKWEPDFYWAEKVF